jgi:hypothetical protein
MSIIKQIIVDMEEARMKEITKDDPFAQAELVARQLGLPPADVVPSPSVNENVDELSKWKAELRSVNRHLETMDKSEGQDYRDAANYRAKILAKIAALTGNDLDESVSGIVFEAADEVVRIVAYWRTHGGLDMNDSDLRKAVSDDFEQLEYPPEEVAKLTARAVKAIKKR